jgi:hypothetical protein
VASPGFPQTAGLALSGGPPGGPSGRGSACFSQHHYQHWPERPVLLAIDQELGEGAALLVAQELSDPVRLLEVGGHQDVTARREERDRARRDAPVVGARARLDAQVADYADLTSEGPSVSYLLDATWSAT